MEVAGRYCALYRSARGELIANCCLDVLLFGVLQLIEAGYLDALRWKDFL
jgi:hypothetical protein